MDKDIAVALGLPATAAPNQALTAINALVAMASDSRKALGLADDAEPAAIATAIQAATAGTSELQGTVKSLQADLIALQAAELDRIVDADVAAGKIPPGSRQAYRDLIGNNRKSYDAIMAAAPAIVAPGETGPGGKPAAAKGGLSAEDVAVCAALGLDQEAFKKARADEEKVV